MPIDSDFAHRLVMTQPWAIEERALEALIEMARVSASVGFDLKAAWGDMAPPAESAQPQSGVGVIPIRGTLKQHDSQNFFDFLFGGASTEAISGQLKAFLADASIRAIVLDIDSPGGSSYGVSELANEIMAARGQKPILAVANSVAASAAFWVGAAADRLYATPGALVGSVGVYIMHEDISKMAEDLGVKVTFVQAGKNKTRGNEFEPLADEDVAHFQAIVDETYATMVNDIARGRGVTAAQVRSGYGEGDILTATQAKKAGMIDGIKTLAEVITEAQTARPRALKAGPAAEAVIPDLEAQDDPPTPQMDEEGTRRLDRMRLRPFEAARATAIIAV